MIVIAILAILSATGIPQFFRLLTKTQEGATKANLAVIRSALAIYYGDTEGSYPTNITALTSNGRYLQRIPNAVIPPHT